jgi:hypothetical protein
MTCVMYDLEHVLDGDPCLLDNACACNLTIAHGGLARYVQPASRFDSLGERKLTPSRSAPFPYSMSFDAHFSILFSIDATRPKLSA